MKKIFFAFICLTLSLSASAFPERSDVLIQGMLKNRQLQNIMTTLSNNSEGYNDSFDSIKITRAEQSFKQFCRENSRSGAVLKVEIGLGERVATYYFSTSGSAKDLRLCE